MSIETKISMSWISNFGDSKEEEATRKIGCEFISNPKDITNLFEMKYHIGKQEGKL